MKITKLVKLGVIAGAGMMLAPKDGKALRSDFKKKYEDSKPKLKKMSKQIDILFERVKTMNSDKAKTAAKDKLSELKNAVKSMDGNSVKNGTAKTFKALQKGINKVATDIRKNEKLMTAVKKTGKAAVDLTIYTGEQTVKAATKISGATVKKAKASLEENPEADGFGSKVAKIVVNTDKGVKKTTEFTKKNINPKVKKTVEGTKKLTKATVGAITGKEAKKPAKKAAGK